VVFTAPAGQAQDVTQRFWARLKQDAPQFFVGENMGFSPHIVNQQVGLRLFDPGGKFPAPADVDGYKAIEAAVQKAAKAEGLVVSRDETFLFYLDTIWRSNDWKTARQPVTLGALLPPPATAPAPRVMPKTKTMTVDGEKQVVKVSTLPPEEQAAIRAELEAKNAKRQAEWQAVEPAVRARRKAVESLYQRGGLASGTTQATSYESRLARRGRSDLLGRLDDPSGRAGGPSGSQTLAGRTRALLERALAEAEAAVAQAPQAQPWRAPLSSVTSTPQSGWGGHVYGSDAPESIDDFRRSYGPHASRRRGH
jgi:hypothetical protein